MKVNISYGKPLTFDEFKERFEQYFLLNDPERKEAEMKEAWEKAEDNVKVKPEVSEIITIDYENGNGDTEKGENKTFIPDT